MKEFIVAMLLGKVYTTFTINYKKIYEAGVKMTPEMVNGLLHASITDTMDNLKATQEEIVKLHAEQKSKQEIIDHLISQALSKSDSDGSNSQKN